MARIEKIGNVYYRVTDFEQAFTFYRDVLELPLKFRDGSNWAAFDVAGMTLAIEPTDKTPESGGAIVSLKVVGLEDFVAQIRARGGDVDDVVLGAHERRAMLRDPSGNALVLYEGLPSVT